jgi:hypothetical protein
MILAAFVGGGKVGTRVPLNLGSRRFSRIERLFDTLRNACSQGKREKPRRLSGALLVYVYSHRRALMTASSVADSAMIRTIAAATAG